MSVEKIAEPGQTEDSGILKPPVEEKEINEDEIGLGVDANGFWHFVCHSKKGIHAVLGFLEMSKDAVKAHYIQQMRAEAEEKKRKGLLRPDNINSIVDKVKNKFRR